VPIVEVGQCTHLSLELTQHSISAVAKSQLQFTSKKIL
jgi:hypothetical protein